MAKRIVVAVTNDLLTDQRVDRSCCALREAGYEVTLVGRRLPESGALEAREYRCVRMRLLFRRSALFYAEYNLRLLLRLLLMRADAYYANDSDTLEGCYWAARMRRKVLLYDAHELFPDVPELVDKPRVRRVWQWVEKRCLPRVDAAFTVSQSVADEYKRRYGIEMTVVRNLPQGMEHDACCMDNYLGKAEKAQSSILNTKLILYQGAVNVGRGVRELVDVMGRLPQCRLMVVGDGDLLEELRDYAMGLPWAERIEMRGRVRPETLRRLTPSADLGVCLLEDKGKSYRSALPNRIGDYVQAGVPIVATGFVEIRRLLELYNIGTTTEPCPPVKEGSAYEEYLDRLANTIGETLNLWEAMAPEERRKRFDFARRELCWEKEKKKLIERIDAIIDKKRRYEKN